MKRLRVLIIVLLLVITGAPAIVALASDISDALFYGIVQVTNNSTATTNVATTANISTTSLIAGGYLNATANNCAMRNTSGADVEFMPGYTPDGNPWCMWVQTIGADSALNYILYTANSTGGEIRYFPDDAGMTTPDDNADFEPGANFTIEQKGWVDTTYTCGVDGNLVDKYGAFTTRIGSTGNITSHIANYALNGDGNADHLDPAAYIGDYGAAFSFDCWYNVDTLGAGQHYMFMNGVITDNNINVYVMRQAADLAIKTRTAAAVTKADSASDLTQDNEWHHFAVTYNAGAVFFYFDGVQEVPDANTLPGGLVASDSNLSRFMDSSVAGAEAWLGDMDDIRTWGRVLSQADVTQIYNCGWGAAPLNLANCDVWYKLNEGAGGAAADAALPANNAVVNNATWTEGLLYDGPQATATGISSDNMTVTTATTTLDFDGASTTIDCGNDPSFDVTTGLTIETWFLADGNGTQRALVSKTTPPWEYRITAADFLTFQVNRNGGNLGAHANVAIVDGTLYHTVFTFSNSIANANGEYHSIYIDGTLRANVWDWGVDTNANLATSADKVYIGSRGAGSFWNDGGIAVVRMYNRAIDATEVAEHYGGTFTNETGLIGYWELDEGSGTLATDDSPEGNDGTIANGTWGNELLRIQIDGVTRGVGNGGTVPNNANDWAFAENGSILYLESQEITIGGQQRQYIEWEYAAVFDDASAFDNDATPSFRTASSDADVTANMTGFFPVAEAKAPDYVLREAPPFIDADALTGNVTGSFTTDPPTGGFPLAGVIVAVATATGTPPQLPLLIIAVFLILAASFTISATMRKHGSGTLIVKIIVIVAFMGIFVAFKNFGIDFWMVVVFLIISCAIAMMSRQLGWT